MAAKNTSTTKTAPPRKAKKKPATKPAQAKKPRTKAADSKGSANAKKLSAIDAASKVLGEAKAPMGTREMIQAMAAKKYWTSPAGRTPHATLYSAIAREISKQGKESRFKKAGRGTFALNR